MDKSEIVYGEFADVVLAALCLYLHSLYKIIVNYFSPFVKVLIIMTIFINDVSYLLIEQNIILI